MSGARSQPWHKAHAGGRAYIQDPGTGKLRFVGRATAIRFGDGDWERIDHQAGPMVRRWRKRARRS